MHQLGVYY